MIKTKCPTCSINNSLILYKANFDLNKVSELTFSARRIPDRIHYQIVKCKKCGLVYSNPILGYSEIEKLYKKSKYTYGEYEDDLNKTYGRYLKKLVDKLPAKEKLLEIGCGNGFFLKEAKKMGFEEVFGVEPGRETVAKAHKEVKKNIIVDVFRKGQFKKDYFDVICMFQVLDHLTDPNSVLQECFRILKRGGSLICINHDVDAMSAKILGEKSPIFDIEHTYLYNKRTLRQVFEKNQFKVLEVFDVSNYYPITYWFKMLPLPKSWKETLLKICIFWHFDFKFWINAGNIGIISVKPYEK